MRHGRERCLGFLLGLAGEPTERLGHGAGPLCARHAPLHRRAALSAPSLPEAFPRFRGRMGRSDFPLPVPAPPVALGVGVPESSSWQHEGSPGFRALPVPACRRLRPRWTRVRARLSARSLRPSPPLHTGRRPRCRGFRGWSRSVPPLAAFGPQDSCLRFAQAVTGLDARLGPSDPMARRVAGGTSYATPGRRSPTGKRRLSPAHATSPLTCPKRALKVLVLAAKARRISGSRPMRPSVPSPAFRSVRRLWRCSGCTPACLDQSLFIAVLLLGPPQE